MQARRKQPPLQAFEAQAEPHAGRGQTRALDLEPVIDRLRERLKLAVVFAGDRSKDGTVVHRSFNTRPWKSYEQVARDIAEALRRLGFRHVELVPEDMALGATLHAHGTHMAWLNTAGVQGINPSCHAPATLEMLGIPYVGHNPLAVTMLDNKHWFKRELAAHGFATPEFITWNQARGPFDPRADKHFVRRFGASPGPLVVKPAVGRASLHVHLVDRPDRLAETVAEVGVTTNGDVLVEAFAGGREFVVAAAGPTIARDGALFRLDTPFVFGAQERVLSPGEQIFTSMDQKPITRDRVNPLERREDAPLRAELMALAREVFATFQLASLIRLDIRADQQGRLQILEANPKPDLKRPAGSVTSLVGEGLAEFGMSYDDLILSLLADRVDHLIRRQPGLYRHIEAIL